MITTFFPKNSGADRLERDAERHAFELDLERERYGACDDVPVDRLVVNYLRHQCTDYDEDQTQERHREACEAISTRFPWLAQECARQIKRRAAAEREEEEVAAEYEAELAQLRAERRALVDSSLQAIKSLSVGQKVMFKDRRNTYEAEISKIGRSKVTVTYEVKTGKDRARTKTVHAALVAPVEN